ncbi:MAG: hypothetical protein WDO18_02350 [Acidobacteriota bacterium]
MICSRSWSWVLLLAPLASAQALDLTVLSVSPQQALIQYTPPSTKLCTLSMVSKGVLAENVWDVDEAAFAGASYDKARVNTTEQFGVRQVLLGARQAQRDRLGRLRSRSLQANTPYDVTVVCDGTTATASFTTANIPVGNLVPDPPDVSPRRVWERRLADGGLERSKRHLHRSEKRPGNAAGSLVRPRAMDCAKPEICGRSSGRIVE